MGSFKRLGILVGGGSAPGINAVMGRHFGVAVLAESLIDKLDPAELVELQDVEVHFTLPRHT